MPAYQLAVVTIGRIHFDLELGAGHGLRLRQEAARRGHTVLGAPAPITDLAGAQAAALALKNQPADLLVIFYATFADSQMITALTDALELPVFLWAVPDERTHQRLHLASYTGINLGAHTLKRAGKNYDFAYTAPEHGESWRRLEVQAAAGRVCRLLSQARLGVVGERPAGMDTCDLDPPALGRLGVQVQPVDLAKVFEGILSPDLAEVAALRHILDQKVDGLAELEPQALQRTLAASLVMQQAADQLQLSALAVRCWPEFFAQLGCAACGALSLLSDACIPATCEADANGAISQLILQWLCGGPAFNSDVVEVDAQRDEIVLWHCGQAALSLADPDTRPRGAVHSNRKVPLMMDFALKPGPVTLLRLSAANGPLKMVAGRGEMLKAPKAYTGTSGVFRFERGAAEFSERFLSLGMEHHISLAYGDYMDELAALAKMLGLSFERL